MKIVVGCASLLAVGAVAGCGRTPTEPGNIPGGAEVGSLRVLLGSDTPAEQLDPRVEEVWVRLESVEARHESEGWITLSEERQDFDLMAGAGGIDIPDEDAVGGGADDGGVNPLPGAEAELIGLGEVWTGTYDRLRVGIADTWIVVDGAQQDLKFMGNIDPLDPFSMGLTVNRSFFVDESAETTVRIVWDLGQNLRENDNGVWALGANTNLEVDISDVVGGGAD